MMKACRVRPGPRRYGLPIEPSVATSREGLHTCTFESASQVPPLVGQWNDLGLKSKYGIAEWHEVNCKLMKRCALWGSKVRMHQINSIGALTTHSCIYPVHIPKLDMDMPTVVPIITHKGVTQDAGGVERAAKRFSPTLH